MEIYLGDRIKQIRKAKKMSQEEFSELLGLSQPAVSQFEKGLRQPTPKTIDKICEVLKVSRNELVGEGNQENFETAMLMRNLKGMSPDSIRKLNELAIMLKGK